MMWLCAPDRVGRAAFDSSELTKLTRVGFILSGDSWGTMDTHGMGPERMIVAASEVSFKGYIFSEWTLLTTPDISDIRSDRGAAGRDQLWFLGCRGIEQCRGQGDSGSFTAGGSQPWTGFT